MKQEIESLKYFKNKYKRNSIIQWIIQTSGLNKKMEKFTLDEISQIITSAGYSRQHAHKTKLFLKRHINLNKQAHKSK